MATSRRSPPGQPSRPPDPPADGAREGGRPSGEDIAAAQGKGPPVGELATVVFGVTRGAAGRLVVEAGAHAGEEVLLGAGSCVIGRSSSCALVLRRSAGISRRHAKVHYSDGVYFLEDLESRNGTKRNGELIEGRIRLEDGDVIGISGDLIRFISPPPQGEAGEPLAQDTGASPTSAESAAAPRKSPRTADEDTAPVPDATPYVYGTRPPRRMGPGAWVGVLLGGILTSCLALLFDLVALDGRMVDSLLGAELPPESQPEAPTQPETQAEGPGTLPPPTTPAEEDQPADAATAGREDAVADPMVGEGAAGGEPEAPAEASQVPSGGSNIVRAVASGAVERVHVRVGDNVQAGQLLISLSRANPVQSRKRQALLREEASFAPLAAEGNPRAQQDLEAVRRELRVLETELRATSIRAVAPGRVVTIYVQRGTRVQRGEELLVVDVAGATGQR